MEPFEQASIGREEAIRLADAEWWKAVEPKAAFLRQLQTEELMMPFAKFHECAEAALGRPVFTHEFGRPDMLWEEFHGAREKQTLEGSLDLLGADKIIVLVEAREGEKGQ